MRLDLVLAEMIANDQKVQQIEDLGYNNAIGKKLEVLEFLQQLVMVLVHFCTSGSVTSTCYCGMSSSPNASPYAPRDEFGIYSVMLDRPYTTMGISPNTYGKWQLTISGIHMLVTSVDIRGGILEKIDAWQMEPM